jgi:hypothetical protein
MNEDRLLRLRSLRSQPKFVDELGTIYNGMRPEGLRQQAESQLNALIDDLGGEPEDAPTRKSVLRRFRKALARFPAHDTEDRERMCEYLAQIAGIMGTDGYSWLLNRWMYGPILAALLMWSRRAGKAP